VWRQKEAAMEGSRLTKLLLSNSAHEVRTPLNAIINYLEIALEGTLDQETRDNLARSHSASKSLIYVINDLLDLTKTEEGKDLINDEMFDLLATVREATDPFRGDARRKGFQYEVVEHSGLPQWVYGDHRCIRQAISNVIANAIHNTTSGWVRVELWLEGVTDNMAIVEVAVQDSGTGMSNKQLDALFRDLEQVSTDEDELFRDADISNRPLTDRKGDRVLGLGLAVVARIVRNMNGQLRLKSKEGEGSRFVIQLPFSLTKDDGQAASSDEKTSRATAVVTPPPPVSGDELTLVDKGRPLSAQGDIRKYGDERRASLASLGSGSSKSIKSYKSEVDRLIKRISGTFGEQKEEPSRTLDTEQLRILVAEDDPINSRIIMKRLEKSGHKVHGTTNGEECVAAYQEKPALFDVVLMDMQVSTQLL
jgi:CheY-like chemotaxis protein